MSATTGLGPLEIAILEAVELRGGRAGVAHVRCSDVLADLDSRHGIGPRYGYLVLQDLCADWRLHLPLLDCQGNLGSQHGDPAAEAQYTEVRLSEVGALALAAERGTIGPIPLEMIEGSYYRGGSTPPFDPRAVLLAITDGAAHAGYPTLPTGGLVDGDLTALLDGRPARFRLGCTIVVEGGQLVMTEVPLGTGAHEVMRSVAGRAMAWPTVRRYADYEPSEQAPVVDIRDDSSSRTGLRVVIVPHADVTTEDALAWLRDIWPVTFEVEWNLPAPMSTRLASWDAGDGTGVAALKVLVPHR